MSQVWLIQLMVCDQVQRSWLTLEKPLEKEGSLWHDRPFIWRLRTPLTELFSPISATEQKIHSSDRCQKKKRLIQVWDTSVETCKVIKKIFYTDIEWFKKDTMHSSNDTNRKSCEVHFPIQSSSIVSRDLDIEEEGLTKEINLDGNHQSAVSLMRSSQFLKLCPKGKTLKWKDVNFTIVSLAKSSYHIYACDFYMIEYILSHHLFSLCSPTRTRNERFSRMHGVKQKKANSQLSWVAVEVERVLSCPFS